MLTQIEKKLLDPYKLIIVALIVTALVNASPFGYDTVIFSLIISVFVAQVVDIAITYLKSKKFIYGDSATIAALIIANIVMPGQYLIIGVVSALAMILKHLIRFEKKPVFNPASSGMFVATFLFAVVAGVSANDVINTYIGWGNGILPNVLATAAIVILGLLVAIKIRRITASIVYLISYVIMTVAMGGAATLQMYVPFFGAFFMITEPRTSPIKINHQVIFGIAPLAFAILYLMLNLSVFNAFSLGFLSANVLKIGLEKSKL